MHTPTGKIFKLVVLGDGATGKTSLIRAKEKLGFTKKSSITIGVDVNCIPFEYLQDPDDESTFLAMDLGGQKRFHFIHDAYLPGIKAALILYDVSRFQTFLNIPKWYELVTNENPDIPITIVGSKIDLVDKEKKDYYRQELEKIKEDLGNPPNIIAHHFTSAKTYEGVDELFFACEEDMISRYH